MYGRLRLRGNARHDDDKRTKLFRGGVFVPDAYGDGYGRPCHYDAPCSGTGADVPLVVAPGGVRDRVRQQGGKVIPPAVAGLILVAVAALLADRETQGGTTPAKAPVKSPGGKRGRPKGTKKAAAKKATRKVGAAVVGDSDQTPPAPPVVPDHPHSDDDSEKDPDE